MTEATMYAERLSHAAQRAVCAFHGKAFATGYCHLLEAERALHAAKMEVQLYMPEAALNGATIFVDRGQQADIESSRCRSIGRPSNTAADAVLASIGCDRAENINIK